MTIRTTVCIRRGAALLLLAIAGCSSEPVEGPLLIPDDAYVQVMTQLMLLDANPLKGRTVEIRETRADSAREAILEAHGVTVQEILDFADAVGTEAGRMEGLWYRITQQYDSIRVADLRRTTEASSEAEGKLGQDARGPTEVRDDSATTARPAVRGGRRQLQRPEKIRPPAADTAVARG